MNDDEKALRERRARYIKDYGEEVGGDAEPAGDFYDASLTCCVHGRTTRQIHCLNPDYPGCALRRRDDEFDYGRGGRERRYER